MSWPPKEMLKDLVEGKLTSDELREVQRREKDGDRFEKMLEVEQERVPWKERILVPLQEHLYVVQKGKERLVKCSCGYEFGDYKENWKLNALVYIRDPEDGQVFSGPAAAKSDWMILREFFCPGCGQQLEVEAVPHGYPIVLNALPDIDGFYDQRPELRKKVFGKER